YRPSRRTPRRPLVSCSFNVCQQPSPPPSDRNHNALVVLVLHPDFGDAKRRSDLPSRFKRYPGSLLSELRDPHSVEQDELFQPVAISPLSLPFAPSTRS